IAGVEVVADLPRRVPLAPSGPAPPVLPTKQPTLPQRGRDDQGNHADNLERHSNNDDDLLPQASQHTRGPVNLLLRHLYPRASECGSRSLWVVRFGSGSLLYFLLGR
ncbi:hypothetical protein EJB05_50329, partial [Eragrostis curvula]